MFDKKKYVRRRKGQSGQYIERRIEYLRANLRRTSLLIVRTFKSQWKNI